MKQALIVIQKSFIQLLESEDCKLSDRQAYHFFEMAKLVAKECESFTKTEVAEFMHCSTNYPKRV